MKKNGTSLLLLTGLLFWQGCSQPEPMFDLYWGTLPVMEIHEGENGEMTTAMSVFLTLKEDAVAFNGAIFPLETVSDGDAKVRFSTELSLQEGLTVTAIVYDRVGEWLELELEETASALRLYRYEERIRHKTDEYAEVDLTADISHLSAAQKELLGYLFQVSDIMDQIYWNQVFREKQDVLNSMMNEDEIHFFQINYGPWERLNGNLPFLQGYGPKPPGSGFYPEDMSKEEFDRLEHPDKDGLYTLIRRNQAGDLEVIPYHLAYADRVLEASELLRRASALAENDGFGKYLELRAEALLTDRYFESDMAWMDVRENDIDFVVGPIENYEDALFNYKAAHEAFILIKDRQWSEKLDFINAALPDLQRSLPVPAEYKSEIPGTQSDLGAYDVIYYAGDCNAGSKTIAINLPNDERVQASKGSRKLQLKNAIRYKFEEILLPISNVLIAEEQREHVTFEAFFENTMFHEVAHGLGLNQTIHGKGTVRSALKEQYSAMEEGKADILSLHLITQMVEDGLLKENDLMDHYVTFMASIFRSIRFGAASSHGKANMIRFYYFQEAGAFSRDPVNGTYRINFDRMQDAIKSLGSLILTIQGDGDYDRARQLVEEKGFIRSELQQDLDRLKNLDIPVDIIFNQGPGLIGLK